MKSVLTFFIALMFLGCGGSTSTPDDTDTSDLRSIFIPKPTTSFSIVLDEHLPQTYSGTVVDLDAFETSKEQISALHAERKKVFAYISVGSWEPYRPDSDDFEKELIGKVYPGWEDEKFFNIKALDKLAPHIQKRFDMILEKGFDGIEADNIDSYTADLDGANGTGFDIAIDDTRRYVTFLIDEAHKRGLSIGQKNAPELVEKYGALFDWALLEDPFYEKYADIFKAYTDKEKAVFALSYFDNTSEKQFREQVCPAAKRLNFTAILKDRDLTQAEITCPK